MSKSNKKPTRKNILLKVRPELAQQFKANAKRYTDGNVCRLLRIAGTLKLTSRQLAQVKRGDVA